MRIAPHLRSLILACALVAGAPALAQDAGTGFDPRTGDAWTDTWLGDINRYGRAYREPFIDELVRFHGAPRELVNELLARPGWTPGDVYYACRLASVLGRPCRYVVDEYERDRGAGWGALAQRLGIRPGSAEFQRLKRGFVPTYDRWSRPIQLDADLERAFPERARGRSRPDPQREAPAGAAPGKRGAPGGMKGPPRSTPASQEARGRPDTGDGNSPGRGKSGDAKGPRGRPDKQEKPGKGG